MHYLLTPDGQDIKYIVSTQTTCHCTDGAQCFVTIIHPSHAKQDIDWDSESVSINGVRYAVANVVELLGSGEDAGRLSFQCDVDLVAYPTYRFIND